MSLLRRLTFLFLVGLAAGGFAVYRLALPYRGFSGETFVEFPHRTATRRIADAPAEAAGFAVSRLALPYRGFSGETFVEFPHGTATGGIADALVKAGVVRSRWDFLLARVASQTRVLQAGEYRFDRAASPMDVVRRIARGDVFYYELTIPEGRNLFDIAAAAEQLGLFPARKFMAAAGDPTLIQDLDPQAPTLEGYLFPDTYRPSRHTTPDHLCRLMTAKFRDAWHSLRTTAGVHRTVTLASLNLAVM